MLWTDCRAANGARSRVSDESLLIPNMNLGLLCVERGASGASVRAIQQLLLAASSGEVKREKPLPSLSSQVLQKSVPQAPFVGATQCLRYFIDFFLEK